MSPQSADTEMPPPPIPILKWLSCSVSRMPMPDASETTTPTSVRIPPTAIFKRLERSSPWSSRVGMSIPLFSILCEKQRLFTAFPRKKPESPSPGIRAIHDLLTQRHEKGRCRHVQFEARQSPCNNATNNTLGCVREVAWGKIKLAVSNYSQSMTPGSSACLSVACAIRAISSCRGFRERSMAQGSIIKRGFSIKRKIRFSSPLKKTPSTAGCMIIKTPTRSGAFPSFHSSRLRLRDGKGHDFHPLAEAGALLLGHDFAGDAVHQSLEYCRVIGRRQASIPCPWLTAR